MSKINNIKNILLLQLISFILPIITYVQDMSRYRDIKPLSEGVCHFPWADCVKLVDKI